MPTVTLKTILETLGDDYGILRAGTNTGTSASALTDDVRLGGSDGAKGLDPGCAVFVTGGSSGSAPDDEEVRLASRPKLSTGVANLDPALTANLADDDTFVIAFKPFTFKTGSGPHAIIAKLNQVMEAFQFEKLIRPITRVADGDMQAAAETDWTTSNATDVKAAASFPNAERVIVVTDGGSGGGYTSTGNIAVEQNASYYVEVMGFGTDKDDAGSLVVHDVTNNLPITLANTVIDRIEPERLVNSFTTPAGCEQIDIRLTCTNAGDVISWANLILRKNDARQFVLADRQRVMKMGRLLTPTTTAWGTRGTWDEIPSRPEALGSGMWQYTVEQSVSGQSLWYEEFVKPATLSSSTDTTTIPAEHVAAVTAEILLRPLRNRSREWHDLHRDAELAAGGIISAYLQQNEVTVQAPTYAYPVLKV